MIGGKSGAHSKPAELEKRLGKRAMTWKSHAEKRSGIDRNSSFILHIGSCPLSLPPASYLPSVRILSGGKEVPRLPFRPGRDLTWQQAGDLLESFLARVGSLLKDLAYLSVQPRLVLYPD